MNTYDLKLQLSTIPPVFKRKRHVLILLQNTAGNYILGSKHHYPANIARMIGGGLHEYEDSQLGGARELQEETGLIVSAEDLTPLATISAHLTDPQQQTWNFDTFLFFYNVGSQELAATDDLDALVELSENDFNELLERFFHLSTALHPEMQFRWSDYGMLYGEIHRIALTEAQQLT